MAQTVVKESPYLPSASPHEYDMPVQQEPDEPDETPVHYGPPPRESPPPATKPADAEPAPPGPESFEAAPELERPSEHPLNWDPIRDGGEPGTYTADGLRFDTLTTAQPRLRRRERPEEQSFWSRLRPSLRAEPIAGWTAVAVIALGIFLVACLHYVFAISDSQGRLETKLGGRQNRLEKQQKALDDRQGDLEGRQRIVERQVGGLQGELNAKTSGIHQQVQRLQGAVSSLSNEVRSGVKSQLNALELRVARNEQQQKQTSPSPRVTGTVVPGRQSNVDQNPPVATLPMQRPADAGAIDTHDDYAAFEDTVPGGRAKLGIDSSGKKYYELPYTDPRTNTTYMIDVRPFGSSTAGTYVHVTRGAGPIREGQHWVISPSGGWMGPVPQ